MLIDADVLHENGWESDEDCLVWWPEGEPETTYSFTDASDILEDRLMELWDYGD